MELFFEKSYQKIFYDSELNVVYSNWITAPTSEEFREGMNQTIEAFKKFNTGVLISDTTELGAIDPDDQEWSTSEWVANALPAGYRKFAVIVSSDIFAKMSVEDTLSEVQTKHAKLEIQYFPSDEAARKWIKESEGL